MCKLRQGNVSKSKQASINCKHSRIQGDLQNSAVGMKILVFGPTIYFS